MDTDSADEDVTYRVVCNHEGQFSIWPADRENAPGWTDAGPTGAKSICLAYINEVWVDMRPRSLRAHMDAARED